jgi:hypothetical protein
MFSIPSNKCGIFGGLELKGQIYWAKSSNNSQKIKLASIIFSHIQNSAIPLLGKYHFHGIQAMFLRLAFSQRTVCLFWIKFQNPIYTAVFIKTK